MIRIDGIPINLGKVGSWGVRWIPIQFGQLDVAAAAGICLQLINRWWGFSLRLRPAYLLFKPKRNSNVRETLSACEVGKTEDTPAPGPDFIIARQWSL